MLNLAHSVAMFLVNIFKPPFADAYALTESLPNSLIIEHILMIFPPPRLIIPLTTFLETIKGPVKSTFITASKSATSISIIGVLLIIPALLIRISIGPTSASILLIAAITAFSSVTSNK
ncbi:hypothetical protein D3C80_1675240 [compost metagenome]